MTSKTSNSIVPILMAIGTWSIITDQYSRCKYLPQGDNLRRKIEPGFTR